MQNYKVMSETGVAIEGIDGVFPAGAVIQLDPASEQAAALVGSGAIVVTDEQVPEVKKDEVVPPAETEIVPPVEQGSEKDTEPRERYRGIVVLNKYDRTVGEQTFVHIVCIDGTEYDLTQVEAETAIKISFPSNTIK